MSLKKTGGKTALFARKTTKAAHMKSTGNTRASLLKDLKSLGVGNGEGLFVHSSMRAIGPTVGGARTIVEALLEAVGETGLLGMPGFSADAYFPVHIDRSGLTDEQIAQIEDAVPGFDPMKSPTAEMGIIAETFRTWPGTHRSNHPTTSVCLNGPDADAYCAEHSLDWATGEKTPLGKLRTRPNMKILLISVGWNRCSPLHTAENLAQHRRTKIRRFKDMARGGSWVETIDVADDLNRLFPAVGDALEKTGAVGFGKFGSAECKICDYSGLVDFASAWIDRANRESGDKH